ncbi:hypothetical protein UFOVP1196_92 [uncultured Caudovirales phage]|uniref:Uncharacterized protein n=1 Tax=uncultured Caudovirales phage TaxID=2100421 RepID=A0A6J5RAI3_9CAUD|nr:hypothetical protein UFOVP1196_92 [uncultured Caudovirales phage]
MKTVIFTAIALGWLIGAGCGALLMLWVTTSTPQITPENRWLSAWDLGFESGVARAGQSCSEEMKRLRRLGAIGRER